jgi:hypothetical protein
MAPWGYGFPIFPDAWPPRGRRKKRWRSPRTHSRRPSGSDVIGIVAVGATPPDPSERVNVYLPKSLIERIDRLAADLGMNRSSFFGMAASAMIDRHAGRFGTFGPVRK